jgi:putative addiction module component (TIGR02574 family)
MTTNTQAVIRDALALDVDQRSVVANVLINSIDHAEAVDNVDDAWRVEVSRRLDEMRTGAVQPVDADELFAQLQASITD